MPETASSLRQKRHRPVIRLVPALILLACSNGTDPASLTATGEFVMQPSTDCRYEPSYPVTTLAVTSGTLALVQVGSTLTGQVAGLRFGRSGTLPVSGAIVAGRVDGDSVTVEFSLSIFAARLQAPGLVGRITELRRETQAPFGLVPDYSCAFTAVRQ